MQFAQAPRHLAIIGTLLVCAFCSAQTPAPPQLPDSPGPAVKPLGTRPAQTPEEAAEALRISKLAIINGRPYDQPSIHDTLVDYAKDTYGWSGLARTTARAGYAQIHATYFETGTNPPWGTDFAGFMQRFGSAAGVTAINGNVRLAMELIFHEDLRYIPCHGCRKRDKLANALLAEITARHDQDGHRFFTLTPTIADFSGPIVAHTLWYPTYDPMAGVISTRLVFATRVGQHLCQEFIWERRHHAAPYKR